MVITDCQTDAIVYAINKVNLNPYIARWTIHLQSYDILHSAPTNKMMHVDALSRIVAPVDIISLKKELQCHQLADPQIRAISDGLKETEHDKFSGRINI